MVAPRTIKGENDPTKKSDAAKPKIARTRDDGRETEVGKTVANAKKAIGIIDADANANWGQRWSGTPWNCATANALLSVHAVTAKEKIAK